MKLINYFLHWFHLVLLGLYISENLFSGLASFVSLILLNQFPKLYDFLMYKSNNILGSKRDNLIIFRNNQTIISKKQSIFLCIFGKFIELRNYFDAIWFLHFHLQLHRIFLITVKMITRNLTNHFDFYCN